MLKLGIILFIVTGGVVVSLFHQIKDRLGVIEKIIDHIYTSFAIVLMFIGYVNYGGRFIFTTIILYFATALIFSLIFSLAFKLLKN